MGWGPVEEAPPNGPLLVEAPPVEDPLEEAVPLTITVMGLLQDVAAAVAIRTDRTTKDVRRRVERPFIMPLLGRRARNPSPLRWEPPTPR